MDSEIKIALTYAAVISTASTIIMTEVCKFAYRAYKRKCFELEISKSIIDAQNSVIEALQKNKK